MNNDRYIFIKKIGEGSYGIVYLAYDVVDCQQVAVKQVQLPATAEWLGMNMLCQISHRSCPKLLDYFETDTMGYFVMTYFAAENLVNHQLTSKQAKQLAIEMLQVISEMAILQITYNDFKPANLLYDGKHFYLVDYGAMMPIQSRSTRFGSRAFASPEYLSGTDIDWRSDLYSLAKTVDSLIERKNPILRYWLNKSLQLDCSRRFKHIWQAKCVLYFSFKHLLWFATVTICLGCLRLPLKQMAYQCAFEKGDYAFCVQIDSTKKDAYEAYLNSHDPTAYQTWIVLWQWHLPDVSDKTFLWTCIYQLSNFKYEFAWQLQKEILSHLDDQKSTMYFSLLEQKMDLSDFRNWTRTYEDRLYFYRYYLYQKASFLPRQFKMWIEEDNIIEQTDKWTLITDAALLSIDVEFMKEVFEILPGLKEFYGVKARIAYQIFEMGYYQEGWLHQAIMLLDENDELYDDITKKIEQWGSLA